MSTRLAKYERFKNHFGADAMRWSLTALDLTSGPTNAIADGTRNRRSLDSKWAGQVLHHDGHAFEDAASVHRNNHAQPGYSVGGTGDQEPDRRRWFYGSCQPSDFRSRQELPTVAEISH